MREDMYMAIASEMPAFGSLTDAELDSLLGLLNKAWDSCTKYDLAESRRAGTHAALI
jgi:hypothetical protein